VGQRSEGDQGRGEEARPRDRLHPGARAATRGGG
jgi:hypothetical protein